MQRSNLKDLPTFEIEWKHDQKLFWKAEQQAVITENLKFFARVDGHAIRNKLLVKDKDEKRVLPTYDQRRRVIFQ